IHVVDISGRTNELGEPTEEHDPEEDILFLEDEIDCWFTAIIERNWRKVENKVLMEGKDLVKELAGILAGLGIKEGHVKQAVKESDFGGKEKPSSGEISSFARTLRKNSKPIVIAGNKIDVDKNGNFERLKEKYQIVPCCAEAELALRQADAKGFIEYIAGEKDFGVLQEQDEKHAKALDFIKKIIEKHESTGVQECLNKAVFENLGYLVAYPVENENHYSDKKGNVLPDSHLLPPGSNALDLAYTVHSDIGDHFIGAIDCASKMKVGREHELKDGDVIKILTSRK
ncbi:TGS domain-containing protein, partial [Candidatus Altiarchaeota archaeon]